VKHGSLHANVWSSQIFIDRNLDDEALVAWESRESAQVGGSVEEVAVESVHAQASRRSYS
jgi:hypothetical protein